MSETDQGEQVTLALLRNDLMHLTAAVESLRIDVMKMGVDWGLLVREMKALKSQMGVFKWVGGAVSAVVIALVIAVAKEFFGL
jgi:hypothetical protein